jgi:hypothetical protein
MSRFGCNMTHFLAQEFYKALGDKSTNSRSIYYFMARYDVGYIVERSGTRLYSLSDWNKKVPELYKIEQKDIVDNRKDTK